MRNETIKEKIGNKIFAVETNLNFLKNKLPVCCIEREIINDIQKSIEQLKELKTKL